MSTGNLAAEPKRAWVPPTCTLPTIEQPLRVAEFDQLFATALRGMDRPTPTRLRLRLDRSADAVVRELADRETACCSFFDFTFGRSGEDQVVVDVTVPAGQVAVLDAMAARARALAEAAA